MLRQDQALQVATMLYTAFGDYDAHSDDVADQILVIAQAIEANEATPGGIDLVAYVQERGALSAAVRPVLKLVR